MTFRDKLAINIAPIPLRLGLAIVFITMGSAKLWVNGTYTPEQTALLANMGVDIPTEQPAPATDEDDAALTPPTTTPAADAEADTDDAAPQASRGLLARRFPVAAATAPVDPDRGEGERRSLTGAAATTTPSTDAPAIVYTPADFPNGTTQLRKLYGIALMLEQNGPAHHPAVDDPATPENEATSFPLVPQFAAEGEWPRYLALAAAWTEFVGGILILIGLLTRFGAISIVGVMTVALWLTAFGPAIAGGDAIFFFIPKPRGDWHDPGTYQHLFYQLVLWFSALALFFTGAGTLSVDRLLFGRSGESAGDDDDD